MGKRLRKLWAEVHYQTWGRKHVHGWHLMSRLVRLIPGQLRQAVIVDAAVRATQPSVIGGAAYAGPDGLTYAHLYEASMVPHGGMLWPGPETHALRERCDRLTTESAFERDMPSPTEEQIASPEFQALWEVIKSWDINVPEFYKGYCGANGSHVMLLLGALDGAEARVVAMARDLFDNRLGWDDGRQPYAPVAFWMALGMALGVDPNWANTGGDIDDWLTTMTAAQTLYDQAGARVA